MKNSTPPKRWNENPIVSMLIAMGVIIGIPVALYILSAKWSDSPQRQFAATAGIVTIILFVLVRQKYEALIIALIFFSQFQISLLSIDLYEPAKLQIFFTDILFILFIAAAIERRENFYPDTVGSLLLSLVVWQTLAAFSFSAHLHCSLVFLAWQAKYLLIYLFVRNLALSEKMARQIIKTVFLVLFLQGGLAIAQLITGNTIGLFVFGEQDPSRLFYVKDGLRVSGTIGATNAFAGYMAILLVFVLPFMFRWQSIFRYCCFGAGFATLLFALSRAGWLSFIVGGSITVLGLLRSETVKPTRVMILGLIGALIIGSGAVLYLDKIQERFEDKDAIDSAMGRFYQFEQAWPIIERYPVFGIGAGVTEYYGAWNKNARYIRTKLPDVRLGNQPHSSQLQYWIESGTPAFILFMAIIFMSIATALRRQTGTGGASELAVMQIGAGAAAVSAMVHASFGTEINHHQMAMLFWVLFALARNPSKTSLHVSELIFSRAK